MKMRTYQLGWENDMESRLCPKKSKRWAIVKIVQLADVLDVWWLHILAMISWSFFYSHCFVDHRLLLETPLQVKRQASLLLPSLLLASVVTCLLWVDWCHTAAMWSSEHSCYIRTWIICLFPDVISLQA